MVADGAFKAISGAAQVPNELQLWGHWAEEAGVVPDQGIAVRDELRWGRGGRGTRHGLGHDAGVE